MSGKSKLSSFIAKGKKKMAAKAPAADTPATVLPGLEKPAVEATPAVTLDVVQTKVLEQWGGAEDEEMAEDAAEVVVEHHRHNEDEEDEEVDLPSSQARGKYEWKKESTAEETAKREAEENARRKEEEERQRSTFGLVLRRKEKVVDLSGASFPALEKPPAASPSELASSPVESGSTKRRKAKSTSSKAQEEREPASEAAEAEKSLQRTLTGDDIWAIVGKWSAKTWPRVAMDETAVRNRFDATLLKSLA
eukprot:Protomagalhaensia_wolfi_Nauph_80__1200@NODE_1708_length_1387_cov_22_577893_g1325_i0_p1_GENE_NODE_1708_length_1387_cov_22_577893_g1325_i0NODE_1708_length_1387_cov_22_577893_g1325_i0_p1_ORF_typecomplete_len250_score69_02SDA1/PF05285_12/0_0007HD_6/PF18019_1/0_052DUF5423/PF17461_2/3_7Hid1/PF12722_7/2_9FDF/PF09532_10/0_58FDF/PF09532_10/7_9e02_NODE_1708_length_1387_cov_22_577893_g1325_i05521301